MKKWIGNQIGDEGAKTISESLKINTSLTKLSLESDEKIRSKKEKRNEKIQNDKRIGNQIGDEGTKSISESLKINASLTALNLWRDEKIWYERER